MKCHSQARTEKSHFQTCEDLKHYFPCSIYQTSSERSELTKSKPSLNLEIRGFNKEDC